MKRNNLIWLAFVAAFLFSCKPEPQPVNPKALDLGSGVFVLNEGNFNFSNASISFYDIDGDSVVNNLFYKVNDAPLGDVGQSLALTNGQLYIVVNNSNHIYKVDARTMVCDTTKPFKPSTRRARCTSLPPTRLMSPISSAQDFGLSTRRI